ncbi:hypothetical protein IX329_002544 [Fusobacterium necrophorum]|nr:hypothetical protein [Fusobacterium necrophorum]MBR8791105.1 hypothetical protein [Fusobacterium necrophorum]
MFPLELLLTVEILKIKEPLTLLTEQLEFMWLEMQAYIMVLREEFILVQVEEKRKINREPMQQLILMELR